MKNFLKRILQKVKDYFKEKNRPESLFEKEYQNQINKKGDKNES